MTFSAPRRLDEGALDEGALARRIAAAGADGDREAEAAFCRLFAPRIRLYGLKHLRDAHAAADLVQEVLLLTLGKLRAGELREPERAGSFVFGVCRMVVQDSRRGTARREALLERYGEDLPIADAGIAPKLDQERLQECMDTLPERERSVLVMTFYEEMDADGVGRMLGLTAGNVRVIRHRSLDRLRRCMERRSRA